MLARLTCQTFSNPADYDKVQPHDTVDLLGVESMAPESKITMVAKHTDGSEDKIELSHSYNAGQIKWQSVRHSCCALADALAAAPDPRSTSWPPTPRRSERVLATE